jgi:dipeptidase
MCDCAVALGPATRRGAVLFGKNSDREADEPQPMRAFPAREHPRGARVRCTHVEIEQAPATRAVLGSGPFWCWGLEQGSNDAGVAIGNESVFTHEELELAEPGLLGMDLLRLALERAATARAAVETIGALVERHGQGGQGFLHKPLGYSNGFLLADAREAWSLQTSSHRWVARRVRGAEGISNHPSIGDDWELGSPDVERFAIERGWWSPERGRLDFEAAYRSTRLVSAAFSDARRARSGALLDAARGRLDERAMFGLLRDHGPGRLAPPAQQDDSRWTLCAHDPFQGDTTASMVAPLDRAVRWFALAAPCTSVYLPLSVGAKLPATLLAAAAGPTEDSAWWRFKRLQREVERDFAARGPRVRERFDALEADWLADGDAGDPSARAEAAAARALEACDDLLRRFAG